MSKSLQPAANWFAQKGWRPFPFQKETWQACLEGKNGLLNAPTGSGKTYALFLGILSKHLQHNPEPEKPVKGLRAIWITPIRALASEIKIQAERAVEGLGLNWKVATRTGDTSSSERQKQSRNMPQLLITTPESLHLLLAQKKYPQRFKTLEFLVVDEWHELLGSKRGVQMELAMSRLRAMNPGLQTWAISATIGNMDEALQVFLGTNMEKQDFAVVRADIEKEVEVISVLPDEVERFPWSGHLGIKLLEKVVPLIEKSQSTLLFTNTRAQAEIWYQALLEAAPQLAGVLAMHHGSISRELRNWVEDSLHEGTLKAVVCTSSLDLGVDFRPVETIVQIGGPKGVARFIQRAGRSGHQPGAKSKIYFVPTHSLELLEGAALREAIGLKRLESRTPYIRTFDVLVQYLVTLAVSEGFRPAELLPEIRSTHAFASVSDEEWNWCLDFITTGGQSLGAYDEFKKVEIEDGLFKVNSRKVAMRHRLSMGTIVGFTSLHVKYLRGKRLGTVEEWFISQLKPGDVFWFAGRHLELVRVNGMDVLVRKTKSKKGRIPAWLGGTLPLSSMLGSTLREKLQEVVEGGFFDPETKRIQPLLAFQAERSALPGEGQLLVEQFKSREGHHLTIFPFEGRHVHEALGNLLAYRISLIRPISMTIACNDYGFELLSDQPLPFDEALDNDCFTTEFLMDDLQAAVNAAQMARRHFRDIAAIAGLVFQGYPGKHIGGKHLQASSQLFFDVFREYEPENLLFRQAYEEIFQYQLEADRLREALERIQGQEMLRTFPEKPTPFAFPIMVDRLRQGISSEKLADRVRRMQVAFG